MALTDSRLPVAALCGPLGAGETTLLDHVLGYRVEQRTAGIVSGMSEVSIDADRVHGGHAGLSRMHERLVEMTDGCICCTLRDDLPIEAGALPNRCPWRALSRSATRPTAPPATSSGSPRW